MVGAEERMQILKMIADKQITAAEGARLLEALAAGGSDSPRSQHSPGKQGSTGRPPVGGEESRPRWLRVKVTDRHSGRVKLNVTIPVGLVDVGLRMGARFAPELAGMDGNVVQAAIRDGVQGRVLSVDDADDGECVEVFVE